MNKLTLSGALLLCALASGCSREPQMQVVAGECQPAFAGEICSWAEMKGDELLAYGITLPMKVVESVPLDAPMVMPPVVDVVVKMPAAVTAARGVKTLTFYWELHGHPPGPFLTPHFDMHFNSLSAEELLAIDCSDVSKPAEPPVGYTLPDLDIPGMGVLVGLCVPKMGMHAVPETDMEIEGKFEKTMIIGYYKGESIFFEPMIARSYLQMRQSFTQDVPASTCQRERAACAEVADGKLRRDRGVLQLPLYGLVFRRRR